MTLREFILKTRHIEDIDAPLSVIASSIDPTKARGISITAEVSDVYFDYQHNRIYIVGDHLLKDIP